MTPDITPRSRHQAPTHAGRVPNLGGSLAGSGATARMESGDLVITGPVSAFTGTGAQTC